VRERFDELLGICIGVPALLDSDKKTILSSTVLHVNNVKLYQGLKEHFDFPVAIEDETLLAATAEKEMYETKTSPFIYLSINDGLGACVIINEQYLQGVNGGSLEIGHMSLDVNGKRCECGNSGCFEQYVSLTALNRKTEEAIIARPDSVLHAWKAGERPIEEIVAEAARAGDELAERIVEDMAASLGNGIINLINIFNPQTVVIGGRLAALGEPLLAGVLKRVNERAFKPFREVCTVDLARHKGNSVSCGAATYILNIVLTSLLT
jgi:glucokinase